MDATTILFLVFLVAMVAMHLGGHGHGSGGHGHGSGGHGHGSGGHGHGGGHGNDESEPVERAASEPDEKASPGGHAHQTPA